MSPEHIYPLPIGLARAASTRPALHAALRTLGQLGYSFVYEQPLDGFLASSEDYPSLRIYPGNPLTAFFITGPTEDCEDERVVDPLDERRGQEAALRAVAAAINARRAPRRR